MKFEFSQESLEKSSNGIHPVGAEFFRADRQTDRQI
jgi:hypothetical protein